MGEGHDPRDDAREARHGGKDHEGPGGIPVSWGGNWETEKKKRSRHESASFEAFDPSSA